MLLNKFIFSFFFSFNIDTHKTLNILIVRRPSQLWKYIFDFVRSDLDSLTNVEKLFIMLWKSSFHVFHMTEDKEA